MKRKTFLLGSAVLFLFLTAEQSAVKAGALRGCELWLKTLVPSLLPFFAAANLLNRLGLPDMLEQCCGLLTERLFRLPGCAAGALILGLTGGYPLGAAAAAELWKSGRLRREEAERLLFFCDNTGPAFAVAAFGGVLRSPAAGALLYLIHAFSALLLGFLFRGRQTVLSGGETARRDGESETGFAAALTSAVIAAGTALLRLGSFVVFFSALLGALDAAGVTGEAALRLSLLTGWEIGLCRTLILSLFELSGTVGLLSGAPLCPGVMALSAFALSWGGLCVQCQSAAVTEGLSGTRRFAGKLLHGLLSAGLAYIMSTVWLG